MAAIHQGASRQMTWLEDPPPWLRPAHCFASVIVWREKKNVTTSDRFMILILTVKQPATTLSFSRGFIIYLFTWALCGVRDSVWPDLSWGFFSPQNDLAPLLRWRSHCFLTNTPVPLLKTALFAPLMVRSFLILYSAYNWTTCQNAIIGSADVNFCQPTGDRRLSCTVGVERGASRPTA